MMGLTGCWSSKSHQFCTFLMYNIPVAYIVVMRHTVFPTPTGTVWFRFLKNEFSNELITTKPCWHSEEPLLLQYCGISVKHSSLPYAMQAIYFCIHTLKQLRIHARLPFFFTWNPKILLTQPKCIHGPPTLYPMHMFMPHCGVWMGRTCVQVFPRRQW